MSGVVLNKICKVYDNKFTAVKDFNLNVEENEFIVFVGPSGCGKSTTLRMIAGLEEISDGELYINDKLCNDVAPKDRDIAMVFQNYALYPHMTCYENMSFALKLRKTPKGEIDEKVKEAAKILDIEHLLERKPKALSGGQRQRVAMGRAIVRNPKVFLMDEPLSNLDAKLRVQMRAEIAKLHKKLKTTFIYVTHDQTEAMTLGSRIVVMKDGIAQQIASPEDIYNKPENLFVATFMGSPQMNTFKGVILEKNEKKYIRILGKEVELPKEKIRKLKAIDYKNKEVIVGIRSENLSCDEEALENSKIIFKCNVEIAENLGAETLLYVNIEDRQLIIKSSTAKAAKMGEEIRFVMDLEKIHIFDKDKEITIA